MSSNAALTLGGDDLLPSVKVRASAVFSILSSYVRRGEKQARVIGTLMGTVNEGNVVEVRMIIWSFLFPTTSWYCKSITVAPITTILYSLIIAFLSLFR